MKKSIIPRTAKSNQIAIEDHVLIDNSENMRESGKNTAKYSALQQCYDILERGDSSPRYLSYVALAIETWNSVCEEEGGMNC